MTTNLILKSGTVYLRFSNGRKFDIMSSTKIVVNKNNWNSRTQKIKSIVKNSDVLNRKLALLKIQVLDDFNEAFVSGDVINTAWLKSSVNQFFNRPKEEKGLYNSRDRIFYVDFCYHWLENVAPTYLNKNGIYMTIAERNKYKSFVDIVSAYDKNIRFGSLDHRTIVGFVNYLSQENYASNTISRNLGRFRFFIHRAEEENIRIDLSYKKNIAIPKTKKIVEPYLNEEEIETIYNLELSGLMDDVRDNLIIVCRTGLRCGDLMSLKIDNFIDDFIEVKTSKTNTNVIIPINRMIKNILIKRNGNLPSKMSNSFFNREVKEICRLACLDNEMEGMLYDSVKKRKVFGVYPKYKLVTSHIGRRSMATNLIGEIPDKTIMAILGWSSTEILYNYVKTTKNESANKLKEYWNK